MKTKESYPWDLLPHLGARVEAGQREEAHAELDMLLETIAAHRPGSLMERKFRCAACISLLIRRTIAGGAPAERVWEEHLEIYERLHRARTFNNARERMHDFVDRLIDFVLAARSTSIERLVHRIHADMQDSLAEHANLGEYAQRAGLSEGHLSRMFTAISGRTFTEVLRATRNEEARRLLVETDLKIKVIAQRVGLADASQFVADFKKANGVTPGEYRRHHRSLA